MRIPKLGSNQGQYNICAGQLVQYGQIFNALINRIWHHGPEAVIAWCPTGLNQRARHQNKKSAINAAVNIIEFKTVF